MLRPLNFLYLGVAKIAKKRSLKFSDNEVCKFHQGRWSMAMLMSIIPWRTQLIYLTTRFGCRMVQMTLSIKQRVSLYNRGYLLLVNYNHYFLLKFPFGNCSCNGNLYVASVNTTQYGLRSVKFTGPRLWNSLPTRITNSNTLRIFRKTLSSIVILINYLP